MGLLLIYLPRKDERLSWPSWLTCSGRFTHIVVTRRLQAERRTRSVRRTKTGVLPTVLRMKRAGDTNVHIFIRQVAFSVIEFYVVVSDFMSDYRKK